MPQNTPLVIVGASRLVAPYLFNRLHKLDMTAEVVTRKHIDCPEGFTLTQMDLTGARNWIAPEGATIISFLPLPVLVQFLPRFIGTKAIIALGTTIVFSKKGSESISEHRLAVGLEQSEQILREWGKRSLVHCTLLRPTMIYDGKNDGNITGMMKCIQRYHFLPLAGAASGLRQPIHAEDVAAAIVACIDNPAVYDKALNIAGSEVLTYRAMVERVFEAMGKKPRVITLPMQFVTKFFNTAEKMGFLKAVSFGSSVFQRMNDDLIYDIADGLALLKYQPRPFKPEFET